MWARTHTAMCARQGESTLIKNTCFSIVVIQTVFVNVTCSLLKFDSRKKKRNQTVKLSGSNFCLVLVCRLVQNHFELFHPN